MISTQTISVLLMCTLMVFRAFLFLLKKVLFTIQCCLQFTAPNIISRMLQYFLFHLQKYVFLAISRWRPNKTSLNVKHHSPKPKAYGFVYSNPRSSHWSLPVTNFKIVIASRLQFNTNLADLANVV
jgi:hypothetical protein